jgi:hypothetical protein
MLKEKEANVAEVVAALADERVFLDGHGILKGMMPCAPYITLQVWRFYYGCGNSSYTLGHSGGIRRYL